MGYLRRLIFTVIFIVNYSSMGKHSEGSRKSYAKKRRLRQKKKKDQGYFSFNRLCNVGFNSENSIQEDQSSQNTSIKPVEKPTSIKPVEKLTSIKPVEKSVQKWLAAQTPSPSCSSKPKSTPSYMTIIRNDPLFLGLTEKVFFEKGLVNIKKKELKKHSMKKH